VRIEEPTVQPGTVLGLAALTTGAAVMAISSVTTVPTAALSGGGAPTEQIGRSRDDRSPAPGPRDSDRSSVRAAVAAAAAAETTRRVPVDRPDAGQDNAGEVERRTAAERSLLDPAFVRIVSIGATSALTPLGLHDDGTLEVPVDFAVAGWYSLGPRPGQKGAAVIAGHLDSYNGPAVFAKLPEVRPGDEIEVTRKDGSLVRFMVTRTDIYPKDRFPSMAVYGPTDGPELRVITCGGSFDRSRGSYRDNIVLYATMIGEQPAVS
jgi:hypothetical protein